METLKGNNAAKIMLQPPKWSSKGGVPTAGPLQNCWCAPNSSALYNEQQPRRQQAAEP